MIYTFREQRKLTQAETRAYLKVIGGRLVPESGTTYALALEIKNTGQTLADFVAGGIEVLYIPERRDDGTVEQESAKEVFPVGFRGLEADGTHRAVVHGIDRSLFAHMPETVTRQMLLGTDTTRPHLVLFQGVLSYWDVYDAERELHVLLHTFHVNTEGETVLGDGVGWYGDKIPEANS